MQEQICSKEHAQTKAAIKMRNLRADPLHAKVRRAKANLRRMSRIVAEHEVMKRQHPGLCETQQVKTAGICYRNLLVQVVIYKINYYLQHPHRKPNV